MAIEPTLEDATELDRSEESSTTALYRAAIGPINSSYYLPLFARFEAADRGGISWNWAAALTTLNWLAFRQLWSAALAYAGAAVGLALLIFGIGRLVFRFSEPVEWGLLAAFAAALFIVPGLFGNALLHAESRKRMERALAANTTLPEACDMLARQAPTQRRMTSLAAINGVGLLLLVGAWLNFPEAGGIAKDAMAQTGKASAPGATASGPVLAAAPASAAKPALPASAASAPMPVASAPAQTASSPRPTASAPTPAASAATRAASAPAVAASSPARAASAPVAVASAPARTASTPAKPASAAVPAASAVKPVTSVAAKPATPASAAASAPAKAPAVAASRGASGPVQAAARQPATPALAPASSTAQETGKVYRSEPAPAAINPVAGKPTPPAAAPARRPSAPAANGAHLINVGLFAVESNATNALSKLKDAGLPAYSQEIKSPAKGKLIRVRVGPFANQAEAEAAAMKVRALGLDALVAPQ